jgi:glycosyltransferase involved in cell wall biosynthesis
MLAWSRWHTEPRSNRYHYAIRFARQLPVIFVEADLSADAQQFDFEDTGIEGITLMHVPQLFGPEQSACINRALLEKRLTKPLLWIYEPGFIDFAIGRCAPLKVYHASEDYFSTEIFPSLDESFQARLHEVLSHVDLVVAVSEGVRNSYLQRGGYEGRIILLPNGCDYKFYAPSPQEIEEQVARAVNSKIVFYQGNINHRLDFKVLAEIVAGMPGWEFWFCGRVENDVQEPWGELIRHSNVKYFGFVPVEQVRELAFKASVGIGPYAPKEEMLAAGIPLKAFEYVACALPVVIAPFHSLQGFQEVFEFASTAQEYMEAITRAAATRYDPTAIKKRLEIASQQDYDKRFEALVGEIGALMKEDRPFRPRLQVLVLYDDATTSIRKIRARLKNFQKRLRHSISYAAANPNSSNLPEPVDLSLFDVVIIHESLNPCFNNILPIYADALTGFGGLKLLFAQGGRENAEILRHWIDKFGIQVVFTSLTQDAIARSFPAAMFPGVEFVNVPAGGKRSKLDAEIVGSVFDRWRIKPNGALPITDTPARQSLVDLVRVLYQRLNLAWLFLLK